MADLLLDDYLKTIPWQNQHRLDQKVNKRDEKVRIARKIKVWENLTLPNVTDIDVADIQKDKSDQAQQRMALLDKWTQKNGERATYRQLAECLHDAGEIEALDTLCKELGSTQGATRAEPGTLSDDGSQRKGLMCFTDWTTLCRPDDRAPNVGALWTQPALLWEKKEIKVKFENDIPPWKNDEGKWINVTDILSIANQWHDCGPSVVPKFVMYDNGPSDIRVEFNENGVSWSCVGRTAPADKTTMKLSFTGRRRDEYKHVILHEFGHALGLIHEHQHEDAPIVYNDQKLKEYVKDALIHQNRSHSPTDVEKEIKDQWGKMTGGFSGFGKPICGPYDKESVMHYVIPEVLQEGGQRGPITENTTLSSGDKKYIVELYKSVIRSEPPGPAIGGIIRGDNGTPKSRVPADFKKFGKPELGKLIDIGVRFQHKWEDIGTKLKVEDYRLKAIKKDNPSDAQACMREVFTEWERGITSPYTWENLAEVLCSPAINEKKVLEDMYKECLKQE